MANSSENWSHIIEANKSERSYWRDLWHYKELFMFMAWRDILVRYKQTIFGIAWSVIRPLLTMIVFSFIFGRVAKIDSGGLPYPVLVYAAMLPWHFFAYSFQESSNSLVLNANLVSKIYFPRIIIPVSTTIVNLVDFCISFTIYIILMVVYDVPMTARMLLLPMFLLLAFLTSIGAGLFVSALNVKYRDFRYIVPFVVQFGLYISPVGFSSAVIPEKWRLLYSLNPMVGVIDGFRWALLGGETALYIPGFMVSIGLTMLFLVFGIFYFRKVERSFADII